MRKIGLAVGGMVLFILNAVTQGHACSCVTLGEPVSTLERAAGALNGSSAVFSGKVVRHEWRKGIPNQYALEHRQRSGGTLEWETRVVVLKVDQWWKGSLPDEVVLVTGEWRTADGIVGNNSCDYYFSESKNYVVFASGPESELRTHACSSTSEINRVGKDFLEALGKGNAPVRKFEVEKPKVSIHLPSISRLFAAD